MPIVNSSINKNYPINTTCAEDQQEEYKCNERVEDDIYSYGFDPEYKNKQNYNIVHIPEVRTTKISSNIMFTYLLNSIRYRIAKSRHKYEILRPLFVRR